MEYQIVANATPGIAFDEDWYLGQNQDVAEAVRSGGLASGLQHFLLHGFAEGRSPVPPNGHAVIPALSPPESAGEQCSGPSFLAPRELSRSQLGLRRAVLIGSCSLEAWGLHTSGPDCRMDFFTVNNAAELPTRTREEIFEYDFQLIQIQLRAVVGDVECTRMSYSESLGYEAAFQRACDRLELLLELWMKYNREYGLLTFVTNFFVPQENLTGRLLPNYDLRNPAYFINRLNEFLEQRVLAHKNAYILNIDKISASLGRRYVQDDAIYITSHNAVFPLSVPVSDRIEPLDEMSSYYDIRWHGEFKEAVWSELTAMLRTIRQLDMVKLVAIDLDDTLWTGISGDIAEISPLMVEGWPLGLVEALLYLRKRGVLLAIISRNDEGRIRQIWDEIFVGRLALDDFAAVRINWRPKAENMQEVLEIVNIMPNSVVFIDDNPVERAAMQHAFPDMRILGRNPYFLRRILLWAPETQVAAITDESGRRTEMVQAQFAREEKRGTVSRTEFLAAAAPKVKMSRIDSVDHPRFGRTLELLNKTNQFNTTGRRWKLEECDELLRTGGNIWTFEVSDSFTNYGLVGVVITRGKNIEQWVMSCRVLGYQIEEAVMAHILRSLMNGTDDQVYGRLVETEANFPCRDLFAKCGFEQHGDIWIVSPEKVVVAPGHVTMLEG